MSFNHIIRKAENNKARITNWMYICIILIRKISQIEVSKYEKLR